MRYDNLFYKNNNQSGDLLGFLHLVTIEKF